MVMLAILGVSLPPSKPACPIHTSSARFLACSRLDSSSINWDVEQASCSPLAYSLLASYWQPLPMAIPILGECPPGLPKTVGLFYAETNDHCWTACSG